MYLAGRQRTVASDALGRLLVVGMASAVSCGGEISSTDLDAHSDHSILLGSDAATDTSSDTLRASSDAVAARLDGRTLDAVGDTALDAGPCGALGERCCRGAGCNGSLACSKGYCSCISNADCPGGGTCQQGGQCLVTIASDQFLPDSIATDSSGVYWANMGSGAFGSIVKAPLAGGALTTLSAGRTWPTSLVIEAGNLYWVEAEGSSILTVPAVGGAVRTFMPSPAWSVVVDSINAYWSYDSENGSVQRLALVGGAVSTIAAGQRSPTYVALSGGDVYWMGDALKSVSTGGGKVETVAPLPVQAPIAVDASGVYTMVAAGTGYSLVRFPLVGGTSTTLASNQHSAGPIALDDVNVYWATDQSASFVAKTGGAPVPVSATGTAAIAVDATHVYWATTGSFAKIMMLTPK